MGIWTFIATFILIGIGMVLTQDYIKQNKIKGKAKALIFSVWFLILLGFILAIGLIPTEYRDKMRITPTEVEPSSFKENIQEMAPPKVHSEGIDYKGESQKALQDQGSKLEGTSNGLN